MSPRRDRSRSDRIGHLRVRVDGRGCIAMAFSSWMFSSTTTWMILLAPVVRSSPRRVSPHVGMVAKEPEWLARCTTFSCARGCSSESGQRARPIRTLPRTRGCTHARDGGVRALPSLRVRVDGRGWASCAFLIGLFLPHTGMLPTALITSRFSSTHAWMTQREVRWSTGLTVFSPYGG